VTALDDLRKAEELIQRQGRQYASVARGYGLLRIASVCGFHLRIVRRVLRAGATIRRSAERKSRAR